MEKKSEIRKIIEYQNSILPRQERKTEELITELTERVIDQFDNNQFDFSNFTNMTINQSGKRRHIKAYMDFTCEEIMCVYIKRMLDRKFHIKYPNRNKFMHSLFDLLNAVTQMNDFSIIRFDFEDFFNSISSTYVYEKCISNSSLERNQKELISNFVSSTKYAYAGLNTSNLFAEIIAKNFDEILKQKFANYGLIYYRRYIDDGILIFNQFIDAPIFLSIINSAIEETFHDETIRVAPKCKTKLNMSKVQRISKRELSNIKPASMEFDFLGYLFVLKSVNQAETEIKYGITDKKMDKYNKKIDEIINDYKIDMNIEILRHRISAFTSRIVYRINKYKTEIWKVKGFISNYCELRYRIDYLTPTTESFLKNMVSDAFNRAGIDSPYFLMGNEGESVYNLYNNMIKNHTLLFVERIGMGRDRLNQICQKIGIGNDSNKGYDGLVREYLIRIRVGH